MESSHRDLSNVRAEHRPILKNNRNTYHPRFGFTPKTGKAFPKTGFLFLLCVFEKSDIQHGVCHFQIDLKLGQVEFSKDK